MERAGGRTPAAKAGEGDEAARRFRSRSRTCSSVCGPACARRLPLLAAKPTRWLPRRGGSWRALPPSAAAARDGFSGGEADDDGHRLCERCRAASRRSSSELRGVTEKLRRRGSTGAGGLHAVPKGVRAYGVAADCTLPSPRPLRRCALAALAPPVSLAERIIAVVVVVVAAAAAPLLDDHPGAACASCPRRACCPCQLACCSRRRRCCRCRRLCAATVVRRARSARSPSTYSEATNSTSPAKSHLALTDHHSHDMMAVAVVVVVAVVVAARPGQAGRPTDLVGAGAGHAMSGAARGAVWCGVAWRGVAEATGG